MATQQLWYERHRRMIDVQESGCWEWQGTRIWNGYGRARVGSRLALAHRAVYEALVGPIPSGMELDHLCRNRVCVNPNHLEPVTPAENARRGFGQGGLNARKTHCPAGHPYSPENTRYYRGWRYCRACRSKRSN